jgi:Helix-turn-helix domain
MNRWNTTFPGMLLHARTYAAYPVWSDSTSAEVRFQPMTKREARQLWDHARRFERQTREPGKHGGALGRIGLDVVYALTHDFLNFRSGALYPSQATIARAANCCEKSVERALKRLKAAGLLNWLRRCEPVVQPDGGFLLRQISNAYALLPCSQWKGYKPPPPPPPPAPTCWGARPPEDPYAEAGNDMAARLTALEAEAKLGSDLSVVLATELRRRMERNS